MPSAERVHNLLQMCGSNLIIRSMARSLGLAKSGHPPNVFSSWLEHNADYVRAWHGKNVPMTRLPRLTFNRKID